MNYCGHGVYRPWAGHWKCPSCDLESMCMLMRETKSQRVWDAARFAVYVHALRVIMKRHDPRMFWPEVRS